MNILKCEILSKGTVEDKTFYVWTSVSWGPKGGVGGEGVGVVLPLLTNPSFFFSPFLSSFSSFSSLVKIRAGEARPQRHVTAQEPNG